MINSQTFINKTCETIVTRKNTVQKILTIPHADMRLSNNLQIITKNRELVDVIPSKHVSQSKMVP